MFAERGQLWEGYRRAPAAKHYHQAYRHGLLEHCLGVAQAVSAIADLPGIDRDVAVTGALLHDVGKVEAYSEDPRSIDFTDVGRLHGEIALGYYRIRRTIEDIEGFPEELAMAVGHIILSHHGSLEHGSPVVPCTREATLVHMIDNLGGRLGSFDRLEKELAAGEQWSGLIVRSARRRTSWGAVSRPSPCAKRPEQRRLRERWASSLAGIGAGERLGLRGASGHRWAPRESSQIAGAGGDAEGSRIIVSPRGSIFGDGWPRTPRS